MKTIVTNISFTNFGDEKKYFKLICLEDYNEKKDVHDRTFIAFQDFEEDVKDEDKLLSIIEKNKEQIHFAIGSMEKIEKLIDNKNIKITAYTSTYWEDVRLFSNTSKFAYGEDVFNTAAIEGAVYKHIRNKYYNKEILVNMCNEENMPEVMRVLKQSKFTKKEIEETLNNNPNVKKILEINNLYNFLNSELPQKSTVNLRIKI